MNKDIKSIIGISAVCFAALASCKKSSSSPSATANLTGTWTVTQQYVDKNRNGLMDADELDTLVANEMYVFNSDGTLTISFGTLGTQLDWTLANNNTSLKLSDTGVNPVTNYELIQTLTATNLVIKDTFGAALGETTWLYLTKK